MKKTLKISIPGAPPQLTLEAFKDRANSLLNNWEVHVNDSSVKEADCWFIIEDVPNFDNICRVPRENVVFLAAETAQPVSHIEESSHMKSFLEQFGKVFTFHQYNHPNAVSSIPFLPWMINSNHGDTIWAEHDRNVEFFINLTAVEKTKLISVICSKQELTENHRMRIRFVEQLKSHFGDSLDWYGNGVESVSEKWVALAPYKYTVVLENQSRYNVLTEKIFDAYLADAFPIYWGAPNVCDYFASDSLAKIDIEDLAGSIATIESILAMDLTDEKKQMLKENRRIVVSELNFLNRILKIADKLQGVNPRNIELCPQEYFKIVPKNSNDVQKWLITRLNSIDRVLNTNFLNIVKEFYFLMRYNNMSRRIVSKLKSDK